MASRIKVDEVTNLAQSGAVSFPTGGANFQGNVAVSGNIDFSGQLLQNGQPFVTLPAQNTSNLGAVLRSGGSTEQAYWDLSGEGTAEGFSQAKYKAGFNITRGYTCCGYRGGNSWRNVNRLVHATFTQTNLGDLSNWSGAYIDGKPSTNFTGYIFATGNSWDATTNQVSKLNLNTESNAGAATAMAATRNRATSMCRDFVFAYIHGGGNSSQLVKYNLSTEANSRSTNHPDGTQNNPSGGQGATVGWIRGGGARAFNFSTETFYAWTDSPGTDGSNKTLSSRNGFAYWNTSGGYRTSSDWHVRDSYNGGRRASVSKNGMTTGEESMHTGNEYGFIVGQYDGNQNNNGYLFTYASHSFQRDSRMDSLGTSGRASAAGIEFGSLEYGYTGM
tara:strand:+ start:1518 stop:2684 length:1167 start_codon:yes stop_codon:yes gene_type:complete